MAIYTRGPGGGVLRGLGCSYLPELASLKDLLLRLISASVGGGDDLGWW